MISTNKSLFPHKSFGVGVFGVLYLDFVCCTHVGVYFIYTLATSKGFLLSVRASVLAQARELVFCVAPYNIIVLLKVLWLKGLTP